MRLKSQSLYMSQKDVEPVLRRFVSGGMREPEGPGMSLALRGSWGVGKTTFWNRIVRQARPHPLPDISRKRYAYVSLFGLNSLQDVKATLAAAALIDWGPDRNWLGRTTSATNLVPRVAKATTEMMKSIPVVGNAVAGAAEGIGSAIAFQLVKDVLICFDDLERRGTGLEVKDLFGLMTQLRDERGCDVCVIVNDGQLRPGDAEEVRLHEEKALDLQLRFEPSSSWAFDAIFSEPLNAEEAHERDVIRDCCERLSITNLRVLKRLRRAVEELGPHLKGRPEEVTADALKSAILLIWGYHTARGESLITVPDFKQLRRASHPIYFSLLNRKEMNADEQALYDLHERYSHTLNGDVDQDIADYVERGYFDVGSLTDNLNDASRRLNAGAQRKQLTEAWDLFHDSFDDNEDELAAALIAAMRDYPESIEVYNASSTLQLLRKLGHDAVADGLAASYVEAHQHDDKVLHYRSHRFDVDDPKLIECIHAAAADIRDTRTFAEVADKLALSDGWGDGDIELLASKDVAEYEQYFRATGPDIRHLAITRFLEFRAMSHGSSSSIAMKAVAERAEEALRRIAKDHRLNRMRILGRYDIQLDP
jgi:hypothetical protein